MSKHNVLNVIIRDTQNIIFNGDADRVSSYNEVGRFDIYPLHANFISIIAQEISVYNNNTKIKELKIEQAIMKVKQNNVRIFLGIETLFVDENSLK
jgi:F0F1-type ATP synthase epsilon subunit